MSVKLEKSSGQRNYKYKCTNTECEYGQSGKSYDFTSQTRKCVKCKKTTKESPVCKNCLCSVKPILEKCTNPRCDSDKYATIFRTIQVKSSHEEKGETIGFNFKLQDLLDDPRHFLVVYSRTYENNKEKHNFWVMDVDEFNIKYVGNYASTLIYQNNRQHPPSENSNSYFNEVKYNQKREELQSARNNNNYEEIEKLNKELIEIDVFGKLNKRLPLDFYDEIEE